MSKFYASIQGQRGEVTRTGSRSIQGHIRGWNLGVKVEGILREDGTEAFYIYATGGSNGSGRLEPIAIVEKGQALSCMPSSYKTLGGSSHA